MSCDCTGTGLDEIFSERHARRDAKRFRRKGIDPRAQRLLDALDAARPLGGTRTLEVGAGVGGLTISMLRRGAARAHAVDASPPALEQARTLAAEENVADRLELTLADFTTHDMPGAYDVVVLDRVVCCYPDWKTLLGRAAAAAQSTLGFTYPRDAWYAHALFAATNGMQTVLRRQFRVYVHPPEQMHALLREHGLRPEVVGHAGIWEIAVATRGNGTSGR